MSLVHYVNTNIIASGLKLTPYGKHSVIFITSKH